MFFQVVKCRRHLGEGLDTAFLGRGMKNQEHIESEGGNFQKFISGEDGNKALKNLRV